MRKILAFVFLIGLYVVGCNSRLSDKMEITSQPSEFVLVADQGTTADVMYAVDETALQDPGTPVHEPINWIDNDLLLTVGAVLSLLYEFLARKIPTSKTLSLFGVIYKILNYFVPDKSKNGGELGVRDKL